MDASNYDKSEALFNKDSEFRKDIETLYSLYNYKASEVTSISAKPLSFAEIIAASSEGWLADNVTSSSKDALGDEVDDGFETVSSTRDLFAD
jgi:hypothetical protein